MQDMAARIDQVAGTQRNASKVIAELSATGKVGADALETVAVAAIQLQRIGGVAIDDTIRSFVALGEKPAEASRKLNQQYGYLTDAALKRIEIVEREGRATEAATLAQKLFADAAISRTDELAQNLDGVTISARGAKDAVAEVWDGVLDLFRSDNTPNGLQQRLDQARKSLANSSWLDDFNGANNRRREVIADLERQLAVFENIDRIEAKRAARLAGNAAQKAADAQWDRIREANLTKEERLQKEIAAIKAAGLAAKRGEAEIERQIAAARQRFENPAKTKAPKVNAEDSSAKSLMDAVQRQIEANQLLAATGERVSATESLAIRIRQALADKTNGMSEANRALLQSMLPALEASGAAAASAQAEAKAKEELTRRNATLAAQSERLREEAEQQRQRAIMMADPMHGARAALEDYLAMAQNVSEQTYDLLTNSLKGGEDAFVRLATTGKLSFHNLANSIIADIARIAARQAIINPLLGLFGGGGGGLAKSIGFAPVGGTMVAAKGAAFSGGLQTFAAGGAFTNQIVSTPTLFPFAKGTGLMGEAGPEAIMPLKRTQGGQLGVIASGGAGELQVHINNSGGAKVSARQQTSKGPDGQQMRRLLIDVVAEDVASGGGVAAAIRGRFGVAERV